MIDPIVLKGFRDSLPKDEIPKKEIIRRLEKTFTSYGFVPIDTPVLEYTSVLLGKGGGETDKQVFSFEDNGGREVAMRFDLTVPFARFLAAHYSELLLPFKRYHINKVWRGEKPQKGRYREFIQCDFDIVGPDNAIADFEILSIMASSFESLGINEYKIHLSHRGLFNTFLKHLGLEENSVEILRSVDKLRKIGKEEVKTILFDITKDEDKSDKIIEYITSFSPSFDSTLTKLESLSGGPSPSSERLKEIEKLLEKNQLLDKFILDPSITRGLDYYTGIVYETFLDKLPEIGSVSSGGRYNNLASLYTKEVIPGVGASIGLDRLYAALEELGSPLLNNSKSADLLIIPNNSDEEFKVAKELRENGIKVDYYLIENAKPKKYFDYAEKNNIGYSLIINNGQYKLKNHKTRETKDLVSVNEIILEIKEK